MKVLYLWNFINGLCVCVYVCVCVCLCLYFCCTWLVTSDLVLLLFHCQFPLPLSPLDKCSSVSSSLISCLSVFKI